MVLIITWMAVGQLSLSTIGWVFKLREKALEKKNGTDRIDANPWRTSH